MQITPILICLVLISIVQGALVTRIPKPKLSLVHSQNLQIADPPKHKSPEERRKFSLFPKSYMKYVISSEPIYKIATHKPIVHGTKKPLMKKLNFLDKNNNTVENETQPPTINAEHINETNFDVTPKVNIVEISEELSIEIVEEISKERNEKQNDDSEEGVEQQNDSSEIKKATVDIANKDSPNSKDLILPPVVKPVVVSGELNKEIVKEKSEESNEKQNDNSEEENKQQNDSSEIKKPTANKESPNSKDFIILPPEAKPVEVSTEKENIETLNENKNSDENESPDWTEFIFIDLAHKPTGTDKNSSDEPEEYTTTELYAETENVRMKRGSNVIEEENLASTVAGYKYTWKDTRLSNDVPFKNIHS